MGFDSGSLSYQRFAVVGQKPIEAGELLEKIKALAFTESDIGLPADVEYGWCGPQHVQDGAFDHGNCVYNDCLFFALRIDTNTPPPALKRAYQKLEETALAKSNPSGFISKKQKLLAKDTVARKIDEEKRAGKYRRSRHIPLLWDLTADVLYGPTSVGVREKLIELFSRTFQLELVPSTSGTDAIRYVFNTLGDRRAYEDFVPTRFAKSPEDVDAPAEYPWTAKGQGAKDFLGSEFLLWLWYESTVRAGSVKTSMDEITVLFDRSLQLDCVFNHTGKETITATSPTRLPEAIDGLRTGKVPRKAGLIIDLAGGSYNLTLTADSLAVTTLRLPDVEEADTPRTLFEERITRLRHFGKVLDALYVAFLNDRRSRWPARVGEIQKWIASHVKPIAKGAA
jgi:hypothetical protein